MAVIKDYDDPHDIIDGGQRETLGKRGRGSPC